MTININAKELVEILAMTPAEHNIMLAGALGIGNACVFSLTHQSRCPHRSFFLRKNPLENLTKS